MQSNYLLKSALFRHKQYRLKFVDIRKQKSLFLNAMQCNTISRLIIFFYLKLETDKNLKPSAAM